MHNSNGFRIIIVLCALAVAAGVWKFLSGGDRGGGAANLRPAGESAGATGSSTSPIAESPPLDAFGHVSRSGPNARAGAGVTTLSSDEPSGEVLPFSEHWFKETAVEETGSGLMLVRPDPIPTVIRWDSACGAHPFRGFTELGELARTELGVDPSALLQVSLLASQHTVFWQDGAKYKQIAINWEMDDPATYRVSAYESAEPTLTRGVVPLDDPLPKSVNLVAHGGILRRLYGSGSDDLRYGARLATYLTKSLRFKDTTGELKDYQVSLLNQQVTGVHGQDLTCSSASHFRSAFCTCPVGAAEGAGINGGGAPR